MHIIVCVKQVIDPEAPPATFSIDSTLMTAQFKGAVPVIDPFAEHAVEAALKIKDVTNARVTILSFGNSFQRDVIKKPVAMGADELILIEDNSIPAGDSYITALVLARAIQKIGDYNLILCGREASDTNAGQTGAGIAELLKVPCVTLARKIDISGTDLTIERVTPDGYEIIDCSLPAVVTVSNEIGEARYPAIKGIMASKKINPVIWKADEIGIDVNNENFKPRAEIHELYQPVYEGICEFVQGDNAEETGRLLADKLREVKLI